MLYTQRWGLILFIWQICGIPIYMCRVSLYNEVDVFENIVSAIMEEYNNILQTHENVYRFYVPKAIQDYCFALGMSEFHNGPLEIVVYTSI